MNAPFRLPGTPLDPSNPINRGLVGWWPMWEGAGGKTLDISGKNNHGTPINGPTWQDGGFRFDGTDDYVDCGTMGSWGSNRLNGFSVSTLINPATANLQTYFGQIEAASGQNGLSLKVNTNSSNTVSAGSVRVGIVDNATVTLSAATNVDNVPRNAWTRLTITAKPTVGSIEIYVNGVRQSLTYGAANNLTTFANLTYGNFIGAFNNVGTAAGFFQGRIRDFRAWTRVLSALEAQQLTANPNIGLWVPDIRRYYIPAAGAYTLNVDPGAFGITGASAGVLSGRMLSGDPASYAITGAAAATVPGRAISASPGAFDVTGTAAGAIADRIIDASPGTITITGVAAGIVAGRALSADPGALVITGAAADLAYTVTGAYSLNADPGVFSVTGATAGTIAGRVIDALAGGYAVTGLSASIVAGRALSADPAAYTITGASAGVLAGRVIAAEPGVYTVTGANAAAITARLLAADPGAYVITGLAATFTTGLGVQTYAAQILIMSDAREIIIIDDAREIVVN